MGTVAMGPPGPAAVPQTPQWVADVDKVTKDVNSTEEEEEEMIKSANMEPSTLQWPENKPEPQILPVKDGESTSVKSDCISIQGGVSRTECEREEYGLREKEKTGEGWRRMEAGKESVSDTELRNRVKSTCSEIEVEEVNIMPENAARVFSPSITILLSTSQLEAADHWRDEEEERSPFLETHGTPLEEYYNDWPITPKSRCCGFGGSNRDALKLGASMFTSALIFPLLVWGSYIFLPFDAPLLDSAPLRLVYTLRCSVFAVIPIVLGMLVLGVSRLWYRSLKPRFEGEREVQQVAVHQRYVEDSVSLFLLYFLQLAVMAAYLNQDLLKLVPLLTIVFAFGRLHLCPRHPRTTCSSNQTAVLGLDMPHLTPLLLPNVDQISLGLEPS
ncbi:transmembrane protein 79 isoform X2 [Sinocyclocheilus anshuiensis]|uniref:transmembrane protein 79 isoform X2 n=1 Tax=Sinocyclocheilus anshuiensis TaxID=1608454 RepID=UPI0007BA0027|nr:PREDICTED: transmembrane protein 79-like isoform X2 [Sinocyclocheilus anshuiensis]